jgi:hypothetical protein
MTMETTQSNNHQSENIENLNDRPDDIAEDEEAPTGQAAQSSEQDDGAEDASEPGGEEDEGDIAEGNDDDAQPENQEADENASGVATDADNSQWPFGRKATDSEVGTGAEQ